MIDLNTTPQRLFEIVAPLLIKQGRRATWLTTYDVWRCAYLADNGDKCAFGHLIPDGHPAQLDRGPLFYILNKFKDLRTIYGAHEDFLSRFQGFHDGFVYNITGGWRQGLIEFGRAQGLDTSFLDEPKPTLSEADYAEMLAPEELEPAVR